MADRYEESILVTNTTEQYRNFFKDRNVSKINHYNTQKLNYPTDEQLANIDMLQHVWTSSDKLWRLSETYYADPSYWWVIAFFNKKPCELDIESGDVILIPQPLETILFYIKG